MSTLLIYMIKAAIHLTALYMVYLFLLSKDTWYSRNRAYILISVIASLVLPAITIETNKPLGLPIFGRVLSEVFITGTKEGGTLATSENIEIFSLQTFSIAYLAGIIFFGLKLLIDLLKLVLLIFRKRNRSTHIIRFTGLNTAGFSALGQVFINSRLEDEEVDEIIKHEQNHLDHNHFFDILFMEIVKVFQWFNPIIYLLDRSLRAVHEFQADEGCLKTGIPVVNYQRLLLNQVFRSKIFGLSNCFSNPTLIKKRMIMMTKQRSRTGANLKLLISLPVIAAMLTAFSTSTENTYSEIKLNETVTIFPSITDNSSIPYNPVTNGSIAGMAPPPPPPPSPKESSEKNTSTEIQNVNRNITPSEDIESLKVEPFVVVDEMPLFPGGDVALLKYIARETIYPESAKIQNIQGRVIVRFAVTTEGDVTKATILKGVSPELDDEALRVVKDLPKFTPGRQNGINVPVWYMVPITFTLK
jgi:TonB family protein